MLAIELMDAYSGGGVEHALVNIQPLFMILILPLRLRRRNLKMIESKNQMMANSIVPTPPTRKVHLHKTSTVQ